MTEKINRREALKLMGVSSLVFPQSSLRDSRSQNPPNILLLVLDAFSSHNISFLGYPRNNMPYLSKWIERAVVYHNHYAGGPFTTPGTATLLTGVLPWTHRANRVYDTVARPFDTQNIFGEFSKGGYHNFAYTHNPLANILLDQFVRFIPGYIPIKQLMLKTGWELNFTPKDFIVFNQLQKNILTGESSASDDFFFGRFMTSPHEKALREINNLYADQFPMGLPNVDDGENLFLLETGFDWIIDHMKTLPKPFFGYMHFFPPHNAYNTRAEFIDLFNDDMKFIEKPYHPLALKILNHKVVNRHRKNYDEYIAYVDFELNRLLHSLDENGTLEHTWLVITSDHGEMFERGIWGHVDVTLHQPVIQIPLIIFEPGRRERIDIFSKTSAVDILPTLLHVSDLHIPDWCEGIVLPPYNGNELLPRNIYSVLARDNPKYARLVSTTITMIKDNYKLIYYHGYEKLKKYNNIYYELYDLEADPEELHNLYDPESPLFISLSNEFQSKLDQENALYL